MTITDEEVIRRLKEFAGHARTRPAGPPLYLSEEVSSRQTRAAFRRGGFAAVAVAVAAAAATLVAVLDVGQHSPGRVTATSLPATHPSPVTLGPPTAQTPQPPSPVGAATVSVIPEPPVPTSTNPQTGIWTGSQWIVLGSPGAAYTPGHGWAPLPVAPVAFTDPTGVWTGSELLVFNPDSRPQPGAAYNPVTHTWIPIPAPPAGLSGFSQVVWTGTEALVISALNENSYFLGAYDPTTNDWHQLQSSPGTLSLPMAWTGSLLYGVVDIGPFHSGPPNPLQTPHQSGGLVYFDPAQNLWHSVKSPASLAISAAQVAWYGDRVLVLGGGGNANLEYIPATDTWRTLSQAEIDWTTTAAAYSVWTGTQAIFVGYRQLTVYSPASDTWQTVTVNDGHGGPANFTNFVATWAGQRLYLWPESPSEALVIQLPVNTGGGR